MLVPTLHDPLIFLSKAWVHQALTKQLGTFSLIEKKNNFQIWQEHARVVSQGDYYFYE